MRSLLILSLLLAVLYLSPVIGPLAIAAKVGSIILLLILALVERGPAPLVGALSFGAIGDFLLAVPRFGRFGDEQLFIAGLVSFLLGHLCYIALFVRNRADSRTRRMRVTNILNIVLILAFLVGVLVVIWPMLGAMRGAVLLYAAALGGMAVAAQFSKFPELVSLGALSFVISDAMLAFTRFGQPFAHSRGFIWFTYYIAQAAICLGVLAHNYARRSVQPE